jgi:hypothetical protein
MHEVGKINAQVMSHTPVRPCVLSVKVDRISMKFSAECLLGILWVKYNLGLNLSNRNPISVQTK